jgi:hypothetical protein
MKQHYIVLHHHRYGTTVYRVLTDKELTEELVSEHILDEEFEPDRDESLEWLCIDDEEVIETMLVRSLRMVPIMPMQSLKAGSKKVWLLSRERSLTRVGILLMLTYLRSSVIWSAGSTILSMGPEVRVTMETMN